MAVHGLPAARARSSAIVLVAAGLVPLVFRALLPAGAGVNEASDFRDFYDPVARSVLAGRGLFLAPGAPAVAYPPGYPLVLAAVLRLAHVLGLPEHVGLSALTVASTVAAAGLLHALAARVWGPRRALVAALAWLTYPLVLWLTKQPNSELPFMAALYAGVVLFFAALDAPRLAWLRLLGAGAVLGVAMLIRSIALGTSVLLALAFVALRRDVRPGPRLAGAACIIAGSLAVVAPWVAWVYAETGRVVPLSTGGVPSIRDGLTFASGDKPYRVDVGVGDDVRAAMVRLAARRLDTLGDVAAAVRVEVRRDPRAAAKLLALKAARSWYGTDSGRWERAIALIQVFYLGLGAWATVAAFRRRGAARRLAIVVCVLVAYFWGMTVIVLSVVRYMVPVVGLVLALLPAVLPLPARRPA